MAMVFFKDKYLKVSFKRSYKELITSFLNNKKAYNVFLKEKEFEKAFLLSMPGVPKSVIISCEDWNALKLELQKQDPTINFKF